MILAKNQGEITGKTMTQNTTKIDKQEQCDTKQHKTQCTENLFGGRKYLPDPAPPAHAPVSV